MKTETRDQTRYLKFSGYLGYICGVPGMACMNTFVNTFILIFLTDSIGLNAAIIGTLMLVAKFVDGITDLLFGAIMDRTKHRLGKARPWFIRNIVPLVLSACLLFYTPSGGGAASYLYFFVVYLLYNAVCYTIAYLTTSAMPIRMTRNDQERVKMGVFSVIPQMALGIGMSFVTTNLVMKMGGGVAGWRSVAFIYAGIALVLLIICGVFCKELPEEVLSQDETPAEKRAGNEKFSIPDMIRSVSGNKFVWLMFGYTVFFALSTTVANSTGTYYVKYVLGDESLLGMITLVSLLPMIISLIITPLLTRKFSVHTVISRGFTFASVMALLMVIFAFMRQPMLMFAVMALRGLGVGPFTGLSQAVNGQIVEYSRVKDGHDITGNLLGLATLGGKIGEGLSSLVTGALLTISHYDGLAAEQPASAITAIIVIFAVVPFICYIFETIIVWKLNPAAAIKQVLESRGQTAEPPMK